MAFLPASDGAIMVFSGMLTVRGHQCATEALLKITVYRFWYENKALCFRGCEFFKTYEIKYISNTIFFFLRPSDREKGLLKITLKLNLC